MSILSDAAAEDAAYILEYGGDAYSDFLLSQHLLGAFRVPAHAIKFKNGEIRLPDIGWVSCVGYSIDTLPPSKIENAWVEEDGGTWAVRFEVTDP
jgi:hypothetical protein